MPIDALCKSIIHASKKIHHRIWQNKHMHGIAHVQIWLLHQLHAVPLPEANGFDIKRNLTFLLLYELTKATIYLFIILLHYGIIYLVAEATNCTDLILFKHYIRLFWITLLLANVIPCNFLHKLFKNEQ